MVPPSRWNFEDEKLPIEDLRTGLSSLISNYESAESALLWLLSAYRFDRNILRKSLRGLWLLFVFYISCALISSVGERVDGSFANVTFEDMAEFVELNPRLELDDIGTFNLHRSRIPTDLFQSIVEDMDVVLVQYGPPSAQNNEEATSRFLSPVRRFFTCELPKLKHITTDFQPPDSSIRLCF